MLDAYIFIAALTFVLAAIVWTTAYAFNEGAATKYAARVTLAAPVWPALLVVLICLLIRTALPTQDKADEPPLDPITYN